MGRGAEQRRGVTARILGGGRGRFWPVGPGGQRGDAGARACGLSSADRWARGRRERGRRAGVSGPEEGSATRALGLSGEAVWADRRKEKRGELGPGREREEWAAERVGPRV